jgi:hypothetical protein
MANGEFSRPFDVLVLNLIRALPRRQRTCCLHDGKIATYPIQMMFN